MTQHEILVKSATQRGIKVEDISFIMGVEAAIFEQNGTSELIKEGIPTSWLNVTGQFYCDNKQLTKRAFEKLNIPHPKSIAFSMLKEALVFFKKGSTYVCKPLDATHGEGVVMNITKQEQLVDYLRTHQMISDLFLLEEQVPGDDLRFHVIGGKIVAACIRKPAYVVGNGKDSLQILIENRQKEMLGQNPANQLIIDSISLELLQQQDLLLVDIPKKGRQVQLKYVSNMAQGGICIDVTDEIHPLYATWAYNLSTYLGTGYFGLDFLSTDYKAAPIGTAWALEVNARGDWLHHTFSERRQHDMPGIILDELGF